MIGIMADTHDNLPLLRRALTLFQENNCSLVIHAGDFVAPFAARELSSLGRPVKAVFGNCDGERNGLKDAFRHIGIIMEPPFTWEENGRTFFLTHVPHEIEYLAQSGRYDVIIFGHTHRPEIRRSSKTWLINPGETGGWLTGRSSVVLLDPVRLEADIIYL